MVRVIRRKLDRHAVPYSDFNKVHSHFTSQIRKNFSAAIKPDSKRSTWQRFQNFTFKTLL